MSQSATALLTTGQNSTIQLAKGTNLSYQSTGVVVYTHTEIDRWYLGDFVSAEYIINAEFGANERETIHATLVAMPGQTSITIYGRTNLSRSLINIRSDATNSYAQLIVEPASLSVQGVFVSFFANYAKASKPISAQNFIAKSNVSSWSTVANATSLNIQISTANLTGNIIVGQIISNSLLPPLSTVKSWNASTGALVIEWPFAESISAATGQRIIFNISPTQNSNSINVIAPTRTFGTIFVQGQPSINANTTEDYVHFNPGYANTITVNSQTKTITFTNKALTQIAVSGQPTIDTVVSDSHVLTVVAGNNIDIATSFDDSSLTITNTGVTMSADNNDPYLGLNFSILGGTGILTSSNNGNITITNTAPAYTSFSDGSNVALTTSISGTFRFRNGSGIAVAITENDPIYGDNLLISNTGVLSISNLSGIITTDQLATAMISSINSSTSSITNVNTSIFLPTIAMAYFLSR